VWIVLKKEMRHIVRARGTLLLILLSPLLVMVVFSAAMAQDIKGVPITIMDRDKSALSRRFLLSLSSNQDIIVGQEAQSYAQAEQWFNRSKIKALVVIPPDFSEKLAVGESTEVQILVDGTDPTTAGHVVNHVASRSLMFGVEQLARTQERLPWSGPDAVPVDLRVREWYNPGLRNLTGIVPAMLVIALTMPAINVMSSLARERELGTMEIVFATPLGRGELLLGKVLPYVVLGMIASVMCAATAVILFRVPFEGSFPDYLIASLVFFLSTFGLGMLMSIFLKSQAVAVMGGLLIFMFPALFLSGIFYPIASMPAEMQMESQFLPATPFVAVVRGIMVKGQGMLALRSHLSLMVGTAIAYIAGSILLFRKKV
jgi:ABC-2 type transport system permease protein